MKKVWLIMFFSYKERKLKTIEKMYNNFGLRRRIEELKKIEDYSESNGYFATKMVKED